MAKVSVLMAAYNHEKFVAQALDSVLAQKTNFDFEILINDDASTDGTADIIEEYAKNHGEKIKFFRQKKNEGLMKSYERLMGAAKGEYIAFLETDDYYIDQKKLQRQADFFDANPDYSLCAMSFCNVEDEREGRIFDGEGEAALSGEWYGALLKENFIYGVLTVCIRKSAFEKYCQVKEFLKLRFSTFDYPVWLSLARFSKCKFIHFKETGGRPACGYRILDSSISHSKNYKKQRDFFLACGAIQDWALKKFGNFGADVFLVNELRWERLLYWAYDNQKFFDFFRFAKKLHGRRKRFELISRFPFAFYFASIFSKKLKERFYAE